MAEIWHRIYFKNSGGGILDIWDLCPRCWAGLDDYLKTAGDVVTGPAHPQGECSECEQPPATEQEARQ